VGSAPSAHPRRRAIVVVSEAADAGSRAKLGQVLRRAQLASVTIYSVGLSTLRSELQAKPERNGPAPMTPPGTFPMPPMPGTPQTPDTEAARQGAIGAGGADLLALAIWVVKHADDKAKDRALAVASVATGGMHLATFRDRSVEKALDEISGELHAEYSLSYSPSNLDEHGYHEIEVRVKGAKLQVRARPGYYLAEPEG
ncbi:MAG TPA: VWA domain-containing protein, partial [Methylomirabilota bacterium]|nr:VWA domain-containing protein [Methylomirabilota bacterium]